MKLYYMNFSPPCRAVLLTAKALCIQLDKIELNLTKKEQLHEQFLAINPQHCIPTLIDGDIILWESRAICTYLVSQYGTDDSLYPRDPKKRACIDRLLYFDMESLASRFRDYMNPVLFEGQNELDANKLEKLHEALDVLNNHLIMGEFACGDSLTVADHCLVASISSFHEAGIDLTRYEKVRKWLALCERNMAGFEMENLKGVKEFGSFVKKRISEHSKK